MRHSKLYQYIHDHIMLTPYKVRILLLIIVPSIVSLLYQIYEVNSNNPATLSADCSMESKTIITHITPLTTCDNDSDCTASHFSCPFACNIPINKQVQPSDALTKEIAAYNNHCGFCVDRCNTQAATVCIDKHCQIMQAGISK